MRHRSCRAVGRSLALRLAGVLLVLFLTSLLPAVPAEAGEIRFLPPITYDVPEGIPVRAADWDGDGHLDLAIVSRDGYWLLYGNGDGTFDAPVRYLTGHGLHQCVGADVNGDGRLDLVVLQNALAKLLVLINLGHRTFAPAIHYPVGNEPVSIVAADFNRDGALDLAVSNHRSHSMCVLLNRGGGAFRPAVFYGGADHPGMIATADLNGDGLLDLAQTNIVSGVVRLFFGRGDGSFVHGGHVPTNGSYPGAILLDDLDGDGLLDMAVANAWGHSVSVIFAEGAGRFGPPILYAAIGYPMSLAGGDLDGDGDTDLVIATDVADHFVILENEFRGNFLWPVPFTSGDINTRDVVVADFNADGRPDIAIGNRHAPHIAILLNNSGVPSLPPSFVQVTLQPDTVAGGQRSVGRVTLDRPAGPGGLTLTLASDRPAAASVPATILVPPGASGATFDVATSPVTTSTTVNLLVAGAGAARLVTLQVRPGPGSLALALDAESATGGASVTGRLTLDHPAPAGGLVVLLSSSNPLLATVPASVTVPAGQTTATFAVQTLPVFLPTPVVIAAAGAGTLKLATLLLLPGAPDPPVTTATITPAANTRGWHNADVTIDLAARPGPLGTPVQEIRYVLAGGIIEEGAVPGTHAVLAIAAEGTTTVTFYAISHLGHAEAAQSLTIRLDKTPPVIRYSPERGEYVVGETIDIACTPVDALSGIIEHNCSPIQGPASLFKRHEPNVYSHYAKDRAGNVGHGSITFTVRSAEGSHDPLDDLLGDGRPPVTEATQTPPPNSWGWNNQDVTITLQAAAPSIGRNVRRIHYRLSGAENREDAVSGAGVRIPFTAEGETTLTFWAEDTTGKQEAPQTRVVRIDKTAPVVTYEPARQQYRIDEMIHISFRAEDSLSGIAEFTGRDVTGSAALFKLRGLDTFVATATDRAGNVGQAVLKLAIENSFEALAALTRQIVEAPKVARTLSQHPEKARMAAARGARKATVKQINEFIKKVKKQRGRALTPEEADLLIALAREL